MTRVKEAKASVKAVVERNKYYSVPTLAEELGVSKACVNAWIRKDLIVGAFRIGMGAWIIPKDWKLRAYHPNPKVMERLVPRDAISA